MYEDNTACVTQMQTGYIKSNLNKHIAPKYFFPHELQKSGEIQILLAKSCDNLTELFTKSLPASTFEKCVRGIGMRRLRYLQEWGGVPSKVFLFKTSHCALFFYEFFLFEVFS
jgi:hypothetical protein